MPTISIIIPIYNSAADLALCLNSVLTQSFQDFEVICVDDGSTDGSNEILDALAADDSRIILIRQPNAGVSSARNRGLEAATGTFVMFIDSDDVVSPNILGRYLGQFEAGVDLVIDREGSDRLYRGDSLQDLLYEGMRSAWLNPPWGRLFRRSLIDQYGLRFYDGASLGEDLLFNTEYCLKVVGVRALPLHLYQNRMVPGSLTRSYRATKYEELSIVHMKLADLVLGSDLIGGDPTRFRSLLNYLRIKSLVSCANSLFSEDSPVTYAEAKFRIEEMYDAHSPLPVCVGDAQMKAVGHLYEWLGLFRLSGLIRIFQTMRRHIHRD